LTAQSTSRRFRIELAEIVTIFASTLARIDSDKPVGAAARFKPGIGPLKESEVTALLCQRLASRQDGHFSGVGPCGYPGSKAECDLVIPGLWAIEIKLARPFGDNGRPAERWSENLLYPYAGNTSSIGDALKLIGSSFKERKAVMVLGYEHSPPVIPLEPAIRGFEFLAKKVARIALGPRLMNTATSLIHPYHQQVTVFSWEVLGLHPAAA
jgi:hypothetical protein